MNNIAIAILIVILFPVCSLARIGENIDECKNRYGMWKSLHSLSEKRVRAEFTTEIMDVSIIFYEGKCESIEYSRDNEHTNHSFTVEERDMLFMANGNGIPFIYVSNALKHQNPLPIANNIHSSLYTGWKTEDGALQADWGTSFGKPESPLSIVHKVWIYTSESIIHANNDNDDAEAKEKAFKTEKAKMALEGF